MLIEFRVKNFKSFQTEQVLSMVASSDKSLPDNTFTTQALGGLKLLRSAVLYGANASGKSNLNAAVRFVQDFVRQSAQNTPDAEIPVQPFRLDKESRKSPSEFEVTFIHQDIRYQYGFSVDRQHVHEEWLIAYPKGKSQTWFERTAKPDVKEYDWYFGPNLKGEKKRLEGLTRPNALFLSTAATFNHEQLSEVYRWFSRHLLIVDMSESIHKFQQYTAEKAMKDPAFHTIVKHWLQFVDLGIVDFSVKEKILTGMDIQMIHEMKGGNGISFPMQDESLGVQRFFSICSPWIDTLRKGSLIFLGELDSSLHPILVAALVKMFHNSELNLKNAQLVFDTHYVILLDASLFRREQIWFVGKDRGGASHLYSLLDFIPRKNEAFATGYLHGRYGAIPFLREDLLQGLISNAKEE
jgi:AAA15 family ATPase/GTPase